MERFWPLHSTKTSSTRFLKKITQTKCKTLWFHANLKIKTQCWVVIKSKITQLPSKLSEMHIQVVTMPRSAWWTNKWTCSHTPLGSFVKVKMADWIYKETERWCPIKTWLSKLHRIKIWSSTRWSKRNITPTVRQDKSLWKVEEQTCHCLLLHRAQW